MMIEFRLNFIAFCSVENFSNVQKLKKEGRETFFSMLISNKFIKLLTKLFSDFISQ